MHERGRGREVRYPEQVKPVRFYDIPNRNGASAMNVHDSIREQLMIHASKISNETSRRKKIYKFHGRKLDYVMMRTVNLPDSNWPSLDND